VTSDKRIEWRRRRGLSDEDPPMIKVVLGGVALAAIAGGFVSAGMVIWALPLAGKLFGYSGLTLLAVLLASKLVD